MGIRALKRNTKLMGEKEYQKDPTTKQTMIFIKTPNITTFKGVI